MTAKKLNILWQCIATLTLPTGLYAFKKINKLRLGSLTYVLSFAIMVMGITILVILFWNPEGDKSIFYYIGAAMDWMFPISILPPILFMRTWTCSYNEKIMEEAKNLS